ANQLFASYAKSLEIESLANIIGEEELSELDRKYLKFKKEFLFGFINQGFDENRSFEETLDIGWRVLSELPKSELNRIRDEYIDKYYVK
ncbi:MAG: ATP synthase beta subunit C-terminal domain-containing protein, partial [Candidatus Helarchaeota archaeon]